jgi:hypothetical protein
MALNASLPSDTTSFVSDLGSIGRETRAALNALETVVNGISGSASVSEVALTAGQTVLIIGTDIGNVQLEVIYLSSDTTETLVNFTKGTNGQLKIIYFVDANVTIEKLVTKFNLNSSGSFADFEGSAGDILALVNIDGDPTISENGYWQEAWRTPKI